MSNTDKSVDAVEKALGEPAFTEFPENSWKIRTNLIFASTVAIAVVLGNLHIDPDSSIFGLKFKGLSDTIITNGLIAAVSYLLLHFLWVSIDAVFEWRLRITGTRVAFVTTGRISSEHGDYPAEPRQSTLYHWWIEQSKGLGSFETRMTSIEHRLESWDADLRARFTQGTDAMNIVNATTSIAAVRDEIAKFHRAIVESGKIVHATRVPVSLARFNRWFELFLRSQNLRWFVIEFLLPILVGGYALSLLLCR